MSTCQNMKRTTTSSKVSPLSPVEKPSLPSAVPAPPDSTQLSKKVRSRRATTTAEVKAPFPDSDTEPSDESTSTASSTVERMPQEMQSSVSSEYRVSSTSAELPLTSACDASTPTNDDIGKMNKVTKDENEPTPDFGKEQEKKVEAGVLDDSAPPEAPTSNVCSTPAEDVGTNLIVNYLPQNMTQEEIKSLFASIGEVESCKLIRDKSTCQNLGYGFVNYVNAKDAEKAINTLNGLRLQNKTIKVSLARPSSESIKGANLYISGLPKSYTQQEMENLFACCGKIITSRILYDSNTGLSRGVGFIRFDQRSEAEHAIRRLNGAIPPGFTEPITVKLANSPSGGGGGGGVSVNNASLIPILPQQVHPHHHQELLLAAAAAAAAAAVAAGSDINLPAPHGIPSLTAVKALPHSAQPLDMAFMHQMAPLPPNLALTAHPVLQHPHNPLHFAPLHGCPELISRSVPVSCNRQILTSMTAIHVPAPEAVLSAGHLIGPPLPPAPLPGSQGPHLAPASAVAASGVFAPIDTRFRYPLNAATIPQDLTTALSSLSCVTPTSQPTPLIAAPPPPPPHSLLPMSPIRPSSGSGGGSAWCLFVCNLAPETEEATLWRLFGPFGAVRSVSLVREHGPGSKCRGFGFVNMTNYEEALLAIQHLNGYALGNRILQVAFKTLAVNVKTSTSTTASSGQSSA